MFGGSSTEITVDMYRHSAPDFNQLFDDKGGIGVNIYKSNFPLKYK